MVEATENIDLVTLRRQQDLESSQRETRETMALIPPAPVPDSTVSEQNSMTSATIVPIPDHQPTDSIRTEGMGGMTRIIITAGLVILLFIAWAFQKRSSRSS